MSSLTLPSFVSRSKKSASSLACVMPCAVRGGSRFVPVGPVDVAEQASGVGTTRKTRKGRQIGGQRSSCKRGRRDQMDRVPEH